MEKFEMPKQLQGAGGTLHRAMMKIGQIAILPVKFNQMALDLLATGPGKALLSKVPGYGLAMAFLVEPLRDLHQHALDKHTMMMEGRDPGTLKEHLQQMAGIVQKHLPSIKAGWSHIKNANPDFAQSQRDNFKTIRDYAPIFKGAGKAIRNWLTPTNPARAYSPT
jgi:hypothetical protein